MPDTSFDDGWSNVDNDDEDTLQQLPPGEEGMLLSHAGQGVTFYQVLEGVRPGYVSLSNFLHPCDSKLSQMWGSSHMQ